MPKIIGFTPIFGVGTPTPGKLWIRHCPYHAPWVTRFPLRNSNAISATLSNDGKFPTLTTGNAKILNTLEKRQDK